MMNVTKLSNETKRVQMELKTQIISDMVKEDETLLKKATIVLTKAFNEDPELTISVLKQEDHPMQMTSLFDWNFKEKKLSDSMKSELRQVINQINNDRTKAFSDIEFQHGIDYMLYPNDVIYSYFFSCHTRTVNAKVFNINKSNYKHTEGN